MHGQRLGRGTIRKLVQKTFEKVCVYVCTDFFKWAKDINILMSHISAYEKVTSKKEEFSKQVDGMTKSVKR